ncbi:MAG: radical SAM protein [Myxococcales bacterium]|nr:radical SAM protein [Myxococcales bacterium]
MAGLLDVILGYDCNLACDYCTITPEMRPRALTTAQVVACLRRGRALGYDRLSLTGGEPTIRRDLIGLVRAARQLGFDDIKLQSNGLLYAQADNVARLAAAGVTLFHISVHTHEPARYDALVRRAGTYALMRGGLDNVVRSGAPLVVDLILKEDTYRALPEALEWLEARGVQRVDLWFVSLTDGNAANTESMPRMVDVVPYMRDGLARARARGMTIRSLHVPRCLLGDDRQHAFDPGADRVMVVTPEATFELKDSKLTGREHMPCCVSCEHEASCPGVRPDYLARYGDGEFARARGQTPTRAGARRLPLA